MSITISPQENNVLHWLRTNNLTQDFCNFIARSDAYTRFLTGTMGWNWEDEFHLLCMEKGLTSEKAILGARHDSIVNGYRVQCKFSADKKKVDIRNKDKTTQRRYKIGDFDFLALKVVDFGILIIPENELVCSKKEGLLVNSIRVEDYIHCFDDWSKLCLSKPVRNVLLPQVSEHSNVLVDLLSETDWSKLGYKKLSQQELNTYLGENGDGTAPKVSHDSPLHNLSQEIESLQPQKFKTM